MKKLLLLALFGMSSVNAASLVVYSPSNSSATFSVHLNGVSDCREAERSVKEHLSGTYGLHFLCLSDRGDVEYDH